MGLGLRQTKDQVYIMSYRNFSGVPAAAQAATEPWIEQKAAAPEVASAAPVSVPSAEPVTAPVAPAPAPVAPNPTQAPAPPARILLPQSTSPPPLSKLQQAALPAPSPQPAPRAPSRVAQPANFVSNYSRPRAATQVQRQLLPSSTSSGISPLSKGINK
jgi:hypothetical protein